MFPMVVTHPERRSRGRSRLRRARPARDRRDRTRQTGEYETRVPNAEEMADSIDRARRTVREFNAREACDEQAEEHERAAELGR
jgi:hypothetical protein